MFLNKKKYGKLQPKKVERKPWDELCVDLIGQYQLTLKGGGKRYQITTKNRESVYLQVVGYGLDKKFGCHLQPKHQLPSKAIMDLRN